MDLDPMTAANLVDREVHTGSRDGVTTRIVLARRTYQTDQADLWDAVTNPQRLPRWFLPISGDLRPGGHYKVEGNASGTVQTCAEPDMFDVTWEFGGQISWLRVTLTPADNGATLHVAHEAPVDPDFWAQYGPGAVGIGWDLGLVALALHIDTGQAIDPLYTDTWATTEPGIQFVRQATSRWANAATADGDDPTAAHEAADRTLTFYTVPPQQ